MPRLKQRITALKAERSELTKKAAAWETAARTQAAEAQMLREQNAELTQERDQALSGLPDAIRAVPIADFWRLVFTPAREAWRCDSYYQRCCWRPNPRRGTLSKCAAKLPRPL